GLVFFLLKPAQSLSLIGFGLSLMVHICVMFQYVPGQWVTHLHSGMFVVWFLALFLASRLASGRSFAGMAKELYSECSRWMKLSMAAIILYAVLNFAFFMN